jgi:AraC-like DNA-binding protein
MILLDSMLRKTPGMCGAGTFFHYLPIDEETLSQGIYLTGAGRAVIDAGDSYPPSGQPALYQMDWLRGRTLPDFQLLLVTDGAGEFASDATGHVRWEGAAVICIFPGVWHRFRPDPAVGWTERWFAFNGEAIRRLFALEFLGPHQPVSQPREPQKFARAFDELLTGIRDRSSRHPAVMTFQALRIISDAIGQRLDEAINLETLPTWQRRSVPDDPIVQRALEIIWTHSPYPLSVADIARQLPVTRRTLDRRFVEATGRSVLEEINICRLSRAKRLLSETTLPVKTVAHLAGFSSTERMRVLFVEREGQSPSEYRRGTAQMRRTSQELRSPMRGVGMKNR